MIRLLTICFALGCLGCSETTHSEKQTPDVNDAPLVEAFLRLQFAENISNDAPLIIQEQLSMKMMLLVEEEADFTADLIRQAEQQGKRLAEAVRDFCSKNKRTNNLNSIGTLTLKHVVFTDKDMSALFESTGIDGWEEFYKIHPKSPGIITLSRPGLSLDGSLAVIYMGNQTHWLAGRGRIYVLEKKGGKWGENRMCIGPFWMS